MNEREKPDMAESERRVYREDSVPVYDSGRIAIPAPIRDVLGLKPDDIVHVRVVVGDERENFNRPINDTGKVTIPSHIRSEHGIEDGDRVDIEVVGE